MGFKRRETPGERLEKIRIDLPNHWAIGGESLWAADLGGDVFEIRNIPYYIYNLNFHDHVIATSPSEDLKPVIKRVVKRSGHTTLRVFFSDEGRAQSVALLDELSNRGCGYEGVSERYVALNVPPDQDARAIEAQLAQWSAQGLLDYETCEARAPGSFDAGPADPMVD